MNSSTGKPAQKGHTSAPTPKQQPPPKADSNNNSLKEQAQPPPQPMAALPQPAGVTSSTPFPAAHHHQHVEQQQYTVLPVRPHWFYLRNNEQYWFPFSLIDSGKLEEAFIRSQANPSQEVSGY